MKYKSAYWALNEERKNLALSEHFKNSIEKSYPHFNKKKHKIIKVDNLQATENYLWNYNEKLKDTTLSEQNIFKRQR